MDFKFVGKHFAQKTFEQMKEVLMDPKANAPEIFYYMVRGGIDQRNITVWEPGKVGGEYIKSYGHYHIGDLNETYWILFGEGVALLQKTKLNNDGKIVPDEALEFRAIKVKAGDIVKIPKGFGHVFVNTGRTFFVTADDTDVLFDDETPQKYPGHTDYEAVKKMQGFAYYVIEENDLPALKKNKNYKSILKTDFGGLPVL
ncbi:MAG: hypothetical protein HYV90_03640 [Candidatus Woesebacteria bacterium]|nr:MAG: hypothetical protein HYV90_03640 [Candidatus Woesebacteria bacterium]